MTKPITTYLAIALLGCFGLGTASGCGPKEEPMNTEAPSPDSKLKTGTEEDKGKTSDTLTQ